MRLGHVVKSEINTLINIYQGYIDDLVESIPPNEIDENWWRKKDCYSNKIEVLEELLERLEE